MKQVNCVFVTGLVGLFCLVTGIGFACFGAKSIVRMWAWEKLTLKNGSEAMTRWMRPPQPVIMKVYIFNVTNPEAVSEGALPILSEVGPYVYEQALEKVNITQLDNYTLSYQLQNIIKFKENISSQLKDTDLVTILNVPLAGAILSVHETVPEFVGLLNDIWQFFYPGQNNIFITTSVKEILFDGINIDCTSKTTEVYIACRSLETRKSYALRKEGKNFKFSFLHAKNGTSSETYQVNQGIYDFKKSAQYIGVNYSPTINIWKNYYCDMVNGSDGAQFPAMVDKTKKLYIFEKELCRSLYAEFEKEVSKKGVTLYKFSNSKSVFASPKENPDNICFCRSPLDLRELVEEESDGEIDAVQKNPTVCFENGVLPLMPCIGAPIVASFPHFYLGDQSYMNYSGLNPVKELHETYVYVEPISGITVMGFKRIQFNLEVKRIFDVQITSNLVDGLFPILWIEESTELSPDFFKLLRYSLIQKKVVEKGTFVLIGLGAFLVIVTNITRFLTEKSVRSEGALENFVKPHRHNADESKGNEQTVKTRLGVWHNCKASSIPSDSVKFKNTDIEYQRKFLTDNFMR